ncbi:MAG: DUF1682 domain-containing protein [Bacteroidia bacterium]|nr:DUF1682 domain-containing protein [Bacteroidia bacterium]
MRYGLVLVGMALLWAQENQTSKKSPAPSAAAAQREHLSPEKRLEAWTLYLTETLSLTPDQQAKLRDILAQHQKEMQALRGDRSEAAQEKRRALRKNTDAQIQALLTPEQQKKYEAIKADWRARARAWYKAKHGTDPGEE